MRNLISKYRDWRSSVDSYRYFMTNLGRSFLMRDMGLRRIPGMRNLQFQFRLRWPKDDGSNTDEASEIAWMRRSCMETFRPESFASDEALDVMLSEENAKDGVRRMRPDSYWPTLRWEE